MKRKFVVLSGIWGWFCFWLVWAGVGGITGGCGAGGKVCKTNDDCGPGQYCRSDGRCNSGCRLSVECPLGQGCRGNQCLAVTGDVDQDGFFEPIDCNDNDSLINPGADEICGNKIDDNCDGRIDEEGCITIECRPGDTRDCYDGKAATLQVDNTPCRRGRQTCTNSGKWGDCQGQVLPTSERCDGEDNDCNGKIDDGENGKSLTRSCYKGASNTSGVGTCVPGVQTCTQGAWAECVGEVLPQTEVCNGKDDNCDGLVDNVEKSGDSCNTQQSGECAAGRLACDPQQQKLICQQLVQATDEICDQKDNNCDGQVDEGCPYVPQRVASLRSFPHTVGLSDTWAAVSLRDSKRIAVFDLTMSVPKLTHEVEVPEEPHGIQVTQDRAYAVMSGAFYKIDLLLGKSEKVLQTPQTSHAGALVLDGGNLYSRAWSQDQQGNVSVVFCKTDPVIQKITCNAPASGNYQRVGYGLAIRQSSGLMLTNEGIHFFGITDITENPGVRYAVSGDLEDIAVDTVSPTAVVLEPKNSKIYLVDLATRSVIKVLDARDGQGNLATPRRVVMVDGLAFVSLEESGEIAVIDLTQNQIARRIKVGKSPMGMGVGPREAQKGRSLWITCPGDNTVWRFQIP